MVSVSAFATEDKALQIIPKLGFWVKNKPSGNPEELPTEKKNEDQSRTERKKRIFCFPERKLEEFFFLLLKIRLISLQAS
jgi:hypothetical protein